MSLDHNALDASLAAVVDVLEREFSNSLVGVYLEGSFAWGNAITTSDLDLRVITSAPQTEAQREAVAAIKAEAMLRLDREVGINVELMTDLLRVGAVRFQRSRHLAGKDIRALVPLKPVDAFARDSLSTARRLVLDLRKLHGGSAEFPVGPPLAESEFRGFDTQRILDAGRWVASTKRLVTNVTAVATAHVALKAGYYVFSKSDVPTAYTSSIGDEWSALVTEVYEVCRNRWAYRLPDDVHDRGFLTSLCDAAVKFENTLSNFAVGPPP